MECSSPLILKGLCVQQMEIMLHFQVRSETALVNFHKRLNPLELNYSR